MKPKTLIMMVGAIVCGLGAAYVSSKLIQEKKEVATVWVAADNFRPWTPIREPEKMFVPKEILKNELRAKCYPATPEALVSLKDRTFRTGLDKDIAISEDDLLDQKAAGIQGLLPKGAMAMAIKISPESGVGGFVVAGARVNIVQRGRGEAKVILKNILVLAIDLDPNRPVDRPGIVGNTATVQVDEKQAMVLAKAKDAGIIELTLRSFEDKDEAGEIVEDTKPPEPPMPPPVVNGAPKPVDNKKYMRIMGQRGWELWASSINERGETSRWVKVEAPVEAPTPIKPPVQPAPGATNVPMPPAAPTAPGATDKPEAPAAPDKTKASY